MNEFEWFVRCPVPREQRPFYEYLKQKQSTFFSWVTLNQFQYWQRLITTFFALFFLFLPLTLKTISFSSYPLESFYVNLVFSLFALAIVYLYILSGWFYAATRLKDAKVWYEESGWYDGKVWVKPPAILKHERLLYHYQLLPLLTRVKKTVITLVITLSILTSIFFFFFY